MSSTSSRSARRTPKPVSAADISGIQPIGETSAITSAGFTEWTVKLTDGSRYTVSLPGDGRISYGRSPHRDGAEVRFYRNQTTKTYDAVIPNVLMVISNKVSIKNAPKTPEELAAEREREEEREAWEIKRAKEATEYMADLIVKREYTEAGADDF